MRNKKSLAVLGVVALAGSALVAKYSYPMNWAPAGGMSTSDRAHSTSAIPVQLWHCGMHPQFIQDHPGLCPICHMALTPMSNSSHSHDGMAQVTVDPTVVQNMGLHKAMVKRGSLSRSIQTAGMLRIPDPSIFEISMKTSGWITHLHADTEGMQVRQGDLIFDFYSPDLQLAEQDLIEANRLLGAAGSTDLRHQSEMNVAASKERLKLRGVSDAEIESLARAEHAPATISIFSPVSGEVTDKMVVEGSSVESGSKLMRIESHGKLWLDAEVYEDQMGEVALGDQMAATFEALPGREYSGKVSFINPHVDHMSRTVIVRAVMDNPDLSLKPGMYSTIQIMTRAAEDALIIPREAVIDSGTRQIAFVALPEGHFEARVVRLGTVGDDDQVQILEGLSAGETVVTSGQFLLDVESRTIEAIDKMRSSASEMLQPAAQVKGAMQ